MQKEVTTRTWSFSQLVHELEFRQASIIHFVCVRCNITDGVHCSLSLTLIVVYICMLVCMHSLILLLRKCHSFMLHVPLVLHVCFLEKEENARPCSLFLCSCRNFYSAASIKYSEIFSDVIAVLWSSRYRLNSSPNQNAVDAVKQYGDKSCTRFEFVLSERNVCEPMQN